MKKFAERLKQALITSGLTTVELGQQLAVGPKTISRWETGAREPDLETISKVARLLNTSVAYLVGETDNPNAQDAADSKVIKIPVNGGKVYHSDKLLMIPRISSEVRVSAGTGNSYENVQWEVLDRYPVFDGPLSAIYGDDDLTCITVEGDSMEPQIHDGDVVIFNHDPDWVSGNIYVVCHNGLLLVKGLISDGYDKPPILRSTNKDYPDIKIKEDDFFLVYGRVLKIDTTRKPKPVI